MKRITFFATECLAVALLFLSCQTGNRTFPTGCLDNIILKDSSDLELRIEDNLNRLQSERYQPDRAIADDPRWPGDYVGRTILGLVLDSRALHTQARYLPEILHRLPDIMEKGYVGADFSPAINEQQLSGHGWLLRGLCEYYKWKDDKSVLPLVRSIADSLFLRGAGRYARYPISAAERSTAGGEASGSINSTNEEWMLSTDVGCIFIGAAGLVDAYEVLKDPALPPVIEELFGRFVQVDLVGIKMQTHATLSALRGMLKYYSLTGERKWLDAAVERWQTYEDHGMTCTYANYNWFDREDSWTEPCAVVDSYMVAFDLWRFTGVAHYRDMAELIYFNALGHGQRQNGGFGCDNCPSRENPFLRVVKPEATWCCTMRGGEGLPRVAESAWMKKGKSLYAAMLFSSTLETDGLEVKEETAYPEKPGVVFTIVRNARKMNSLLFPDLPWAEDWRITVNGKEIEPEREGGFFKVQYAFKAGDKVEVSFSIKRYDDEWHGCKRFFRGPQLLCSEGAERLDATDVNVLSLTPAGRRTVLSEGKPRQILF